MHVCGDRNAWCCTHGFCTETSRRSARAYYMPFHFVYMCFWLFFVFVFRPAAVALHIFCVLIFSLFLFYSHAKIELTTWCGRHMHSTKHVRDCLFNIHNRFVVFFFRVWVRANEHKVRRMMMAMCRAIWHCIHTRIRAYTHDHSTFAMFHSVCVCVCIQSNIFYFIFIIIVPYNALTFTFFHLYSNIIVLQRSRHDCRQSQFICHDACWSKFAIWWMLWQTITHLHMLHLVGWRWPSNVLCIWHCSTRVRARSNIGHSGGQWSAALRNEHNDCRTICTRSQLGVLSRLENWSEVATNRSRCSSSSDRQDVEGALRARWLRVVCMGTHNTSWSLPPCGTSEQTHSKTFMISHWLVAIHST